MNRISTREHPVTQLIQINNANKATTKSNTKNYQKVTANWMLKSISQEKLKPDNPSRYHNSQFI